MTGQFGAWTTVTVPRAETALRVSAAQPYIEACFEVLLRRFSSAEARAYVPGMRDEETMRKLDRWLESLSLAGSEIIRDDIDHLVVLGWHGRGLRTLLFPMEGFDSERVFVRRFNFFLAQQGLNARFGTDGRHLWVL